VKRIGLFGGTFNPIHIGHLAMAQMVSEKFSLDKIVFVPSHWPPHKSRKNVISARHRYRMVRLAVKGNANFTVSDYEIKKRGKSYSIHTIEYFRKRHPKRTKFFFIIGGDSLTTLNKWKRIQEILKLVTFIAVRRKGFHPRKKGNVRLIDLDLRISSSDLRSRLKQGKSIKYLTPDSVDQYIRKCRLYN